MSLNFSNSRLWTKCGLAVSPVPNPFTAPDAKEVSEARLEGRAAAWVADRVLRHDAGEAADMLGEQSPDGWIVDDEMVRHVQTYIDIVTRHGTPTSEQDVSLWGGLVNGRPDSFMTDDGDTARFYELKYGWRIVEPKGFAQLLLAAVAFAKPTHRLVSLEVFQPRPTHVAGPHRKWVITYAELQTWSAWLLACAQATTIPAPVAVPGEHCDNCPRNAGCPTLDGNVYAQYEIYRDTRRPARMAAPALAAKLKFLYAAQELLKASISGMEAEVTARLQGAPGRPPEYIPGWNMEQIIGQHEWTNTPFDRAIRTGVDIYKKVERTPAELRSDGVDTDGMTTRPHRGFRLAPWSENKIDKIMGEPKL